MIWFLLAVMWLAFGVWGSYIGHRYMVRHYELKVGRGYKIFYAVMSLGGLINLLATTAMFWKR